MIIHQRPLVVVVYDSVGKHYDTTLPLYDNNDGDNFENNNNDIENDNNEHNVQLKFCCGVCDSNTNSTSKSDVINNID